MAQQRSTPTTRRIGAALLIGLGLLLVSTLIFQPASAQREPAKLKPPFKLIGNPAAGPLVGLPPLPLNAPIIINETFGASFQPQPALTGNGWHTLNGNPSGTLQDYSWGRVINRDLMTDTAWIAVERFPASRPEILPGQPYTVNMNSWLVYGPVDFSDYSSIVMSMTYFMDVHPEAVYSDTFGVAYSTDGTNFHIVGTDKGRNPQLDVRHAPTFNLAEVARQPNVWLAFYFTSSNHPIDAKGVFIDDVVVRGAPLYRVYLPIVRRDATPTPTVTPTPSANYLYNYTFGSGSNTSNQNFLDWGSKVSGISCTGTSCNWGQDLQTGGAPDGSLQFYQNGLDSWAGTSPNNLAPTDFEYSADIFVVEPKKNARFGLIFSASSGVFGRDGNGVPTFDPYRNLHKFDLQFDETDETIIKYYRLEACENDIAACPQPVGKTIIPTGYANNVGNWNNIRVQRLGNNLKVYLNNNLLIDITDTAHLGSKKYGVFLQSKDFNSASNPLKIRIDNVRIRTLP